MNYKCLLNIENETIILNIMAKHFWPNKWPIKVLLEKVNTNSLIYTVTKVFILSFKSV